MYFLPKLPTFLLLYLQILKYYFVSLVYCQSDSYILVYVIDVDSQHHPAVEIWGKQFPYWRMEIF